ncbi:hypothetical protein [Mesorhizobium muleiense]|uniref:hypothetical protein n=1 Tax=Mesorhizobium muleiense TaxID=1004279 RepID=UPI0039AFBD06
MIVEGNTARAFTRRDYDWSHRYKTIVQAAAGVPVKIRHRRRSCRPRRHWLAGISGPGAGAGQPKFQEDHLLCVRSAAP